jgi:hypothetical protein
MSESTTKPKAEKAPNYTAEQEAAITAAAPIDLAKAKELAEELGKSWRSIVSKTQSMGLEYIKQEAPTKRPVKSTKAEIVTAIEKELDGDFYGLQNATLGSLVKLCKALHDFMGDDSPEWNL